MPTIIQTVNGKVTGLWGSALRRTPTGKLIALKMGDEVNKGDVILTTQDGIVMLTPEHDAPRAAAAAPATTDIDRVIAELNQPDALTAPAAGLNGGDGGGLQPGLRVGRISEELSSVQFTETTDTQRTTFVERTAVPEDKLNATAPALANSSAITAAEEGAPVSLGLNQPTGSGTIVITVKDVPAIGTIVKADGTVVTPGTSLQPSDLPGLRYLPPADYDGTAPVGDFSYTVTNGSSTSTGTTTIALSTVNDLPDATAGTATSTEDSTLPISLGGTDSDGTVTGVRITNIPAGATVLLADGVTTVTAGQTLTPAQAATLLYKPAPDFNGGGALSFVVIDNDGGVSAPATLQINVTPVNDAPVGQADLATTPEDTVLSGNLLANDTDVDGPALSVTQYSLNGVAHAAGTATALPGIGTLVINADGSYVFTPTANYNGPVPAATYTVSDGSAASTSTLTINVGAVNDAPVAIDDVASTAINTPVTIDVRANDTDADGDTLTVSNPVLANPAQGTVSLDANGQLLFTPANNLTGPVSITYTVTDPSGAAATATVTINVGNNTPPTGTDSTQTLAEDGSHTVLASDFGFADADAGQSFANVRIDTLPAGSLTLNGSPVAAGQVISAAEISAGHLVFTPAANANGTPLTSLSFSVQDSAGAFDTAPNTLSFNVTPVNDAPVAAPDVVTATEDTPVTFDPRSNDTDVDTPVLAIVSVGGQPIAVGTPVVLPQGTVSLNPDGTLSFTPAPNFNGPVNVPYTVSDGSAQSSSTVTINVAPVNDAPVANDDTVSTPINTPVSIDVRANDSDVDGDTLTPSNPVLSNPAQGTASFDSNGQLVYTPAANVTGPVVITYTVTDPSGASTNATVTVNVGANTPPAGADGTHTINEDTAYTLQASDFGFSDGDAGQTFAGVRIDTPPAAGTLELNGTPVTAGTVVSAADIAAGHLVFTPALNGNGAAYAGIGFSVQDSAGAFDPMPNTLSFNVAPVNDAPVANDDLASTAINNAVLIDVKANDTDPDNSASQLTVSNPTIDPSKGTVTVDASGQLLFTPATNVSGPVTITYTLTDPSGLSDTATVTVNVGSNTPPTGTDSAHTIAEDTSYTVTTTDFGFADADAGQAFAAVRIDSVPAIGQLQLNGNPVAAGAVISAAEVAAGHLQFVPASDQNGAPYGSFSFSVQDSAGAFDAAPNTLTLNVTPVNDAPLAAADTAATTEDNAVTFDPRLNDTDIDGPALTITQVAGQPIAVGTPVTLPQGTVSMNADGTLTFTPVPDFNGAVNFPYTVTDGTATSTANVTVNVAAVNDAPVGLDDTATTAEDTPVSGNVLTNDTDTDAGSTLSITQFSINGNTVAAGTTAAIPGVGTLVINADGSYTFAPAADYNGTAPVATYTLSDGTATSTATLTIAVTPVNDTPVGISDTIATTEDTPVSGNVLANDSDVDAGTALTVTQFTVNGSTLSAGTTAAIPGVGTLVINIDGSYTFTPAANYNGTAPVATYTLSDGSLTSTATLTINVTPVNDAPVGVNDTATTAEDTPVSGNVLANDSDVDAGTTLTVTQFTVNGSTIAAGTTATIPGVGTLLINADGNYTFTPAANYNGTAPVATYTLSDGTTTSTATLAINVTPVNDAPVAGDDVATTAINTPVTIPVLANDVDVDGDTLTVSNPVLANPAQGTVSVDAGGNLVFTPANNFSGAVQIQYTVTNPAGLADTATVTVNVGSNTPPTGADSTHTVAEDSSYTVQVADLGFNDADAGQSLANVRIDAVPATGSLQLNGVAVVAGQIVSAAEVAAGHLVFVPAADASGAPYASFSFSVQDDAGAFDAAPNTLTLNVTPVNDAPVGTDDAGTTAEDTALTGNVLGNDTDVDAGTSLSVTQFTVAGVAGTFTAGQAATITGIGALLINADGSYTFTPVADYNGAVPVATYTLSDGALTSTATLAINVTPVNDTPVGSNDTGTVAEDTALNGNVLTNDSDVDAGTALSVTQFTVAGVAGTFTAGQTAAIANVGTLLINADGSYTFTPVADYNGAVPVATYTLSDGSLTSTATLAINVTPVNDAPVAANDTATTTEDTPVSGNVLTNDSDVDSASLNVTQFVVNGSTIAAGTTAAIPGVGTLLINADGSYVFTPALNYNGTVPVATYTLSDGSTTSTATLTINVTPVNDAPVGINDTVTTAEDTAVSGSVLSNDSDVDAGAALTVTQFSVNGSTVAAGTTAAIPGVGTLLINADGNYTFTPATNYNGTVPTATYTLSDGNTTSTATLTINVTPVNDAPVAGDDVATTAINTPITITVLANDVDADGDALTVSSPVLVNPAQGTVSVDASGNLVFTPANNFSGAVQIQYTVTDPSGLSDTATVTVNVGSNTPPTGADSAHTVAEDSSYTVQLADLGFSDADLGQALANVRIDTIPAAGSLQLNGVAVVAGQLVAAADVAAGHLVFVPAANASGAPYANFSFSVQDTAGAFDTVPNTLTLTVTPVNDAPVGTNDTGTTAEDTALTGNVLNNDTDVDTGTTLTVTQFSVAGVAGSFTAGQTASIANVGTLLIDANGNYTFTPALNYNGAVPVATYTLSDGALTSTATLALNVTPVNDAPLGVDDTNATAEDTAVTGNVLSNDSDVDAGTSLSVTQFSVAGVAGSFTAGQIASIANVGTLQINATGIYTFTPAANYNGPVPVATYTLSDGVLTSTATLTLNVTPVNDTPVGADDTGTTAEDTVLNGNVIANDSDVDAGTTLTVTQFTVAGVAGTFTAGQTAGIANVGTLAINADGSYTFTPALNYNGAVPVATYTLSDGTATSTATLTINITPVNDAPVGANDTATTAEDTPVSGNVLTNDTDVDSASRTVTQFTINGSTLSAGTTAAIPGVGTLLINPDGSYTFTPVANYNGAVPVATYTLSDGTATSTAMLTINVTPVNDAPVGVNDTVTTAEDTPVSGDVLANDTDVDAGTALSVTQFTVADVTGTFTAGQTASIANVGTLQINTDGTYTFTPAPNYNGTAPVATYTLSDGTATSTATLAIGVTPVNDAPVGTNDAVSTAEDTALSGNVLTNDTDVDTGASLSVTQFTIGGNTFAAGTTATLAGVGTLVIDTNGNYNFTPAQNYNGAVPVATYTLSDGTATSTATLTISVTPVNDAPVGVDNTATTAEDTPVSGNVLANDSDVDSAPLTVTQFIVNGSTVAAGTTAAIPGVGTLVINIDGSYTFTPAANYNGTAPVATYTLSDGSLTSTATLTINVTPVNDAPVGVNDTASTAEDTPVSGNVLTNDSDVDAGTTLTVTQFTVNGSTIAAGTTAAIPGVGTLLINADGNYTFTPAANYNGIVPVATYTLSDGTTTSTATLAITVTPVNDAPVGTNDASTIAEDTTLNGNVLTNDTDVDTGTTLSVTQFVVAGVAGSFAAGQIATISGVGTLQINGDGTYAFIPALNYNGSVPIATYTLSDGSTTSTATLTINVTPVNDAPVGVNDTVTTAEDTPVTGDVLANDTDVDTGTTLSVTQFTVAGVSGTFTAGQTATIANVGTLLINIDGSYTFTPAANYNGTAPVATYTLSDGSTTSTATLTINVTPVNDAPVAANDTATTTEDTPVSGNVLTNDSDIDNASLNVAQFVVNGSTIAAGTTAAIPGVGTLLINIDGSYTFTPAANYNGTAPVATYTLSDGSTTSTATLTINVTPVNDAPVGANDTATTAEDTTLNGNVLGNDSDVDTGTTLSVTQFTVAGIAGAFTAGQTATIANVGTLLINTDGNYTFTPALNYNGAVPVATYTLSDGALTSTATLTISVTPVNDAPVGTNDAGTIAEDSALNGNVLTNDSDVDAGTSLSVTQFTVAGVTGTFNAGQTANIANVGTLLINANGNYIFTPAANYNGAVPVATYTLSDGALTSTATLTINVTPVNDAPVTTVPGAQTTAEDTPTVFSTANGNAITVADVDGGSLTTTIAVTNGTLTLGSTTGVTVTGNGTGSIVLSGTAAAINAALNGTSYTPTADYNGSATLSVSTSDGALSNAGSVAITVTPVADIANDTATTNEDAAVFINVNANDSFENAGHAITAINGTAISSGGTVAVSNGSVTLNADGTLSFTPSANYNNTTPTTFTYTVTSGGLTETATVSVNVTAVNDAPVTTVPGAQSTAEDTARVFSSANGNAITVADVDGGTLTTTVAVTNGTLTLGSTTGVTVTGNGTGSIVLSGTAAAINAALNGTSYSPTADYNGSATLSVSTSDGSLANAGSVAITVTPVADIANDTVTTNEDTAVVINVNSNDSFENAGHTITAINSTAVSSGGTVAVSNGSVTLNADGTLSFTPATNYNNTTPTTFTYTVTSGGVTETATASVNVTAVNDAPVTTVPAAQTTAEDTAKVFSTANGNAITVTDVDGGSLTTTVAVTNGTLTLGSTTGVTVTGNGTGSIVLSGTAAAINTALNGTSYTPTADYNGSATLSVSTSDGSLSNAGSVAITVTPVADIANDTATTNEDTAVVINVNANDSFESAGHTITAINGTSIASGATISVTNGTVTLNADGTLNFTPATNYNNTTPTTFTYTVTSGGVTETATVSVNVSAVNDAPVTTVPAAQTTAEDTAKVFSTANGNAITVADVDGGSLTTTVAVTNGTLTLGSTTGVTVTGNGTGSIVLSGTAAAINAALNGTSYTSTADYNGSATLSVSTSDGSLSNAGSVAITVTPVADIAADTVTTNEDTAVVINVNANDSFENAGHTITAINGTAVSAGSTVSVSNGTVTLNADGTLGFTPTANYNGTTSFQYTVTSGGVTEVATATVNVTSVNDLPVGRDVAVTTSEDTPFVFGLGNFLMNDVEDGTNVNPGNVRIDTLPSAGSLYLNGVLVTAGQVVTAAQITAGQLSFVPSLNASGTAYATLTFSVQDSSGGFDAAPNTVTLNVTAVNDAPVGVNDTATTAEDTPVSGNVLTNDTDVDSASRTVTQFVVNGTTYTAGTTANLSGVGTLLINPNGNYTFTPAANYNGTVPTATYTLSDGSLTATATLGITVTAVNDAPVGVSDTATTNEDVAVSGNVLTNDTDVDSASLTVTQFVVNGTTYTAGTTATIGGVGTLFISGTGAYTFTPVANYNGTPPNATYTVSDGSLTSTATLAIGVAAVNDAPVAVADTATTTEDTPVSGNVLTNDSDVDSSTLSLTQFSINGTTYAANTTASLSGIGTLTMSSTGAYTFTPASNYGGSVPTATYVVSDGSTTSSSSLSLSITAVADAPTLVVNGSTTTGSTTTTVSLPTSSGLTLQFYDNVAAVGTGNAGTISSVESGVEATTATSSSTATDVAVDSIGMDDAYRFTGYIYLTAGSSYTIGGYRDDTLMVKIGGTSVYAVGFNNWGTLTGTTYTPTVSGYYSIEVIAYNGDGIGSLDLSMSVNGATALDLNTTNFNLYPNSSSFSSSSTVVGSYVPNNDGGYYPGTVAGSEDTTISLGTISATLNDTDGSESLALTIGSIPVGATLSDGTHSFTATSGSATASVTGWTLSSLTLTPAANTSGTYALDVTATSTDSNGSTASSHTSLSVDVLAVADAATLAGATTLISMAQGSSATATLNLPVLATLNDTDGSETLSVAIAGLPSSATLNHGTYSSGTGTWTVSHADLADLTLTLAAGYSTTGTTITITATSTESNNSTTASTSSTLTLIADYTTSTTSGFTTGADSVNANNNNNYIDALAGNDTVDARGGNDLVHGGAGNDSINGGTGNDVLYGDAGNDIIIGGTGSDRILGGAGNDTLTSSSTSGTSDSVTDVFAWTLADAGTTGSAAVDTITDFNTATAAAGGDVLDLRDLLSGDALGAGNTVGNLANYLEFTVSGSGSSATTTIHISSSGGFTDGVYSAAQEDQTIVLSGVNLATAFGLTNSATDSQIIQEMVNRGKLLVDSGG